MSALRALRPVKRVCLRPLESVRTISTSVSRRAPDQYQPFAPPSMNRSSSSPRSTANLSRMHQPIDNVTRLMGHPPSNSSMGPLPTAASIDADGRRISHRESTLRGLEGARHTQALLKYQPRRWEAGSVYAPHDLSAAEMRKRQRRQVPDRDVFDELGINPVDEYKNFAMMAEFATSMGRIKPRRDTGLRAVNQRKIGKAIRRAKGMGLMPGIHKHPEMIVAERKIVDQKWATTMRV